MIDNPDSSLIILAPVNSVLRDLPHKPSSNYYFQQDDPTKNMYKFTLGHIFMAYKGSLSRGDQLKSMNNDTITVEGEEEDEVDNKIYTLNGLNGKVNSTGFAKKAINGVLLKISGILVNGS